MHRRWMSLPLLTSAVSAFYPYHDEHEGGKDKRFIPMQPFSHASQDDLVTVELKKVYHKRDNKFQVVLSNPPSSVNSLAIHQDGADYSYFSSMRFGSKSQEMYMLVDTGSANTWVMGQSCTSKPCTLHNLFGSDDSATLNVTTNKWSLAYGTGSVSGVVANDDVKFANFSINMGFGLATNASDDFNNYPMDGILGLGRATSNELGVPTVMENLKTQGKLAQNVLGIHLNRGSDDSKDGEIVFGGINAARYTGEIHYTKTSNTAAWQIPVDDGYVNDSPCGLKAKTAIIDTGTSYILMPPSDAKKLHSLIPGSINSGENSGETFTVPCDSKANIQVGFSGVKYSISAKDFIGSQASGNNCNSNIIGHQPFGPDDWILGDVFLKNVYAVFDFDQARIGFASPAPSASTPGNSASSTTLATSTSGPSGTASPKSSSTSSTEIGNPFDATSSSSDRNAATTAGPSYCLVLLMVVGFVVGLIV